MGICAWSKGMEKRWELIIDETDKGPRGSHMCPVIDINGDGTDELLYITEKTHNLWEITKEAAMEDVSRLWSIVIPEDLPLMQQSIQNSFQSLDFWDYIWRIKTKSGKVKWLNGRGYPKKQQDGSVIWDTLILDVSRLKEQEENLEKVIEQKNTLFKELHHRIKNNLQLVSSLLNLKSMSIEDEHLKTFARETDTRIKSISKIHDQLLKLEEIDRLDLKAYLEQLCENLLHTYTLEPSRYEIQYDLVPLKLHIDKALILGLITNEIVSNALKYAYPRDQGGEIYLKLKKKQEGYLLMVGDHGVGLKSHPTTSGAPSLGLELIRHFCMQIEANLEETTEQGVHYRIEFHP
jgi:two-component sensor histidine kinase